MPPPLPSESESDRLDWSDDESVQTTNGRAAGDDGVYEPNGATSDSDLHSQPVSIRQPGPKPRGVKRKAEPGSGDSGYPAKIVRGGPGIVESETSDDEANNNSYDSDTSDNNNFPTNGVYVNQSFLADDGPVPDKAMHPSFPETALQMFKRMYPLFSPQPQRPGNLFTHLATQPAKRVPVVTARFNNSKPQNQVSFLMQATGDAIPEHEVCGRCANMSGVFREACVVVREPAVMAITGGACANCWYGRQGSLCSFRSLTPTQHQSAQAVDLGREKPVPVPQILPPFRPAAIPPADVAAPAPAPIHPSYVAALAAGVVAVAPTPVVLSNNGLAGPSSLSRDDKVRVWESRYDKLSTDNPLRAHEHLAEWQEDLTTRLMAMNRVVLMRLKGMEGYIPSDQ